MWEKDSNNAMSHNKDGMIKYASKTRAYKMKKRESFYTGQEGIALFHHHAFRINLGMEGKRIQ